MFTKTEDRALKKALKIIRYTLLTVVVMIAVGMLLVQIPAVQTFIGRTALNSLSKKDMDAKITFSSITLKPFSTLIVKDFCIVDKAPYAVDTASLDPYRKRIFRNLNYRPIDTLFYAGNVTAAFSLRSLVSGRGITFRRVSVRDAVMNLVIEENGHSTNITRMFRIPEKQHKEVEDKEIFLIRTVEVDRMRLCMKVYRTTKCHDIDPSGINWNDMDLRDIVVRGHNLRLRGKVMSGECDYTSFREKSGYFADRVSARTKVGNGTALIEDIRIIDPWSDVDVPHLSFHYSEAHDFADFLDKIRIVGRIEPSKLNFRTLSYFAPRINRNDFILDIGRGTVDGPVDSLAVNLDCATGDGLIKGDVEVRMKGLPDFKNITASAKFKNVRLSSKGAQSLLSSLGKAEGVDIEEYAPGVGFTLDGSLNGRPDDMKFNGFIRTSTSGSLVADLRITDLLDRSAEAAVTGVLRTSSLNIKNLIDWIPAGECTADAAFTARLGASGRGASLQIDSLKINGLNYNGYTYKNIVAAGAVAGHRFDGKIVCNDPNLNFLIQGIMTVSNKTNNALYRFYANIGHADLHALNLDRRGRSEVDLQLSANFTKTGSGIWLGDINLANVNLRNSEGLHSIGDIRIDSFSGGDVYQMRFSSSFAEGDFSGSAPFGKFITDAVGVTAKRELPALFKDSSYEWSDENYRLTFRTFDTSDLLSFIAPGVYIAEGTSVNVSIDREGRMDGRIASQRLAYRERYIKDLTLSFDNAGNTLSASLYGGSTDLSPLFIRKGLLEVKARGDSLSLTATYDNSAEDEGDRGEILAVGNISRAEGGRPAVDARLLPSVLRVNAEDWHILPAHINLTDNTLTVHEFNVYNGEEAISAHGRMSDSAADTLDLDITEFDLSIANALVGSNYDIHGLLSGHAGLTSPKEARRLLLDFNCDSTVIAGERLGNIRLATKWDDTFNRFRVLAANTIDGATTFSVNGTYTPSIRQLDLSAKLNDFSLGFVTPFVKGVFSEVSGRVSGDMAVSGPVDNLSVRSYNPVLNAGRLRIAYTNVAYNASGPFHINDYGIYFDDITLTDDGGNKGRLGGKIGYNHLHDLYLDLNIDLNRLQAINLGENDNNNFYGDLSATGTLSVTGPVHAVNLNANVATAGAGELHVPLKSTQNAGLTDLLKFREPVVEVKIDPYEIYLNHIREVKTTTNDLEVKLNVDTDPEVEVWVEIDRSNGNVIRGRGSGALEIDVRPSAKLFNITGDYTLTTGNYHFVALGLAARDFAIEDGSSIRFDGDIKSSTLNIDASYKTKVSLSTLIADTTSTNSRRTVECGVKVTEKLSDPRLAFSINIPDLDPTVKAQVESALSTEDKVQKQFLSLLISNSFIPDEQSSIVNSSSVLFSNVTEIMSNQINTIFQKLNIPLDLGVNYQQNDSGNDVFDVAVSTQLFNNRVIVNGSIGNRQYQSSNTGGEVAGDLDIEVKLDRAGSFKLSLFSHSADSYTNYLDDTQRNGLGVAYQQEFDKFGQWVRRIFTSRKKRQAEDAENATRRQGEELVEIKINPAE